MAETSNSPARMQRRRTAGHRTDNADVASGIWVVHSMHDRRRIPLLGDLRHEHFYFTEGDAEVDRSEYLIEPVKTTLDRPEDRPVQFDAVVTRVNGTIECRRVRSRRFNQADTVDNLALERHVAAARRFGGILVEITPSELDAASVRIWNWARVIGAYHRTYGYSLKLATASVSARLSSGRAWTLGSLIDALTTYHPAIVTAAVAKLLRDRSVASNLDEATWCRHTKLWDRTS